jgi:hypothetical protein
VWHADEKLAWDEVDGGFEERNFTHHYEVL